MKSCIGVLAAAALLMTMATAAHAKWWIADTESGISALSSASDGRISIGCVRNLTNIPNITITVPQEAPLFPFGPGPTEEHGTVFWTIDGAAPDRTGLIRPMDLDYDAITAALKALGKPVDESQPKPKTKVYFFSPYDGSGSSSQNIAQVRAFLAALRAGNRFTLFVAAGPDSPQRRAIGWSLKGSSAAINAAQRGCGRK